MYNLYINRKWNSLEKIFDKTAITERLLQLDEKHFKNVIIKLKQRLVPTKSQDETEKKSFTTEKKSEQVQTSKIKQITEKKQKQVQTDKNKQITLTNESDSDSTLVENTSTEQEFIKQTEIKDHRTALEKAMSKRTGGKTTIKMEKTEKNPDEEKSFPRQPDEVWNEQEKEFDWSKHKELTENDIVSNLRAARKHKSKGYKEWNLTDHFELQFKERFSKRITTEAIEKLR